MIIKAKYKYLIAVIIPLLIIYSCGNDYTPKPKGYYQIDLPEKEFQQFKSEKCPFIFEFPVYAEIVWDTSFFDTVPESPCWFTINFPGFAGKIHFSYKDLAENDLNKLLRDAHKLTYKHTIKAETIEEKYITNGEVHGILYDIGGNAASNVQFFLTDTTDHFLRGSLYFRTTPNVDSLAPVLNFVKEDMYHLINTFQWKE